MALPTIVALFLYFLVLSFLAIGGLPTVLPEM
jgi:chromate transport protein ChrA